MGPNDMTARRQIWSIVFVFSCATCINLFDLDAKAIWNDEALSFYYSLDGVAAAIRFARTDVHPPLYYMVLALWLHLGESVFILRLLSVLALTTATLFVHFAARRLFDARVGLLAALIFATNPTIVWWAQAARPYGLQTLLVAMAFWGLTAGFLQSDMRERWIGYGILRGIRERRWQPAASVDLACFTYSVAGGLAILTQLPAGFFVLGCNVCIGLLILRDIRSSLYLFGNWVAAQLLLIGLWALWLPSMIVQFERHSKDGGLQNAYQISPRLLVETLMGLISVPTVWRILPVATAVYLICFGRAILRCSRGSVEQASTLAVVITPIAACLLGYLFIHNAFGYVIYSFAWLLVPYSAFIAYGIVGHRRAWVGFAFAVPLLAANLLGLKNYYEIDHPRLELPAAFIAASLRPGDGFILSTILAARWGIAYHWRRSAAGINDRYPTLIVDPLIRSQADARTYPRLWALLPDGVPPMVDLDGSDTGWNKTVDRKFGDLHVKRFDRSGPTAPDVGATDGP